MIVRKYKNGNIDIRYEKDYDPPLNTFDDMVCLIANHTELDVTGLSEPYCLGNAIGMAYDLETINGSYMIASPDFEKFKQGKVVKLYLQEKESEENNMLTRELIMNELRNRGYEVQSADVTKNGVKLQGISIGTETIRPTIYVDEMLDKPLDEVVDNIICTYKETQKHPVSFNPKEFMTWDNIKTKLQLCLQRKGNEDIVKRDFLDLEQYVRVIVDINENGTGSFKVQPSHLTILGITEEQLFNAAWDCTKPTLTSSDMIEVMAEMMGISIEEMKSEMEGIPTQIVISNQSKTHGAIAICDTEMLSQIANKYNADLIILPSSIHECIVMPQTKEDMRFNEFDNMVREVNETEVEPAEQLSDHAYRFNRDTREITYYNREETVKRMTEKVKNGILTLEERFVKVLKWATEQNNLTIMLKVDILKDMYTEYQNGYDVTYDEIDNLLQEWEEEIN